MCEIYFSAIWSQEEDIGVYTSMTDGEDEDWGHYDYYIHDNYTETKGSV